MNKRSWLGRLIYCWKLKRRWSRERIEALERKNSQLQEQLKVAYSQSPFDNVEKIIVSEEAFKLTYGDIKPIDPDNIPKYIKGSKEPKFEPMMTTINLTLPKAEARRAGKTKGAKKCAN